MAALAFILFFGGFAIVSASLPTRDLKTSFIDCKIEKDLKNPLFVAVPDEIRCSKEGGECRGTGVGVNCVCFRGYVTFPERNIEKCNYQRYSTKEMFYFELMMPFGGGHFLSNRIFYGIAKATGFIITIFLIAIIRLFNKEEEEEQSVIVMNLSSLSLITLTGTIIWQLYDLYCFFNNKFLDGNKQLMLPWGEDPLSKGRTLMKY